MSGQFQEIADQLTRQLSLETPPIQVSYLGHPPKGVPVHPGGVPSVCTFFAFGSEKAFYAPLSEHAACEVGAFVLGIPPMGSWEAGSCRPSARCRRKGTSIPAR